VNHLRITQTNGAAMLHDQDGFSASTVTLVTSEFPSTTEWHWEAFRHRQTNPTARPSRWAFRVMLFWRIVDLPGLITSLRNAPDQPGPQITSLWPLNAFLGTEEPRGKTMGHHRSAGTDRHHRQRTESSPGYINFGPYCFRANLTCKVKVGFGTPGLHAMGVANTQAGFGPTRRRLKGFVGTHHATFSRGHTPGGSTHRQLGCRLPIGLGGGIDPHASPTSTKLVWAKDPAVSTCGPDGAGGLAG